MADQRLDESGKFIRRHVRAGVVGVEVLLVEKRLIE